MENDAATRERLAQFIRDKARAERVEVSRLERMSGGAVQQNWAVDAEITGGERAGHREWVLRIDAPASVAESLTRAQEFQVLEAMGDANVLAPHLVWLCDDASVLG